MKQPIAVKHKGTKVRRQTTVAPNYRGADLSISNRPGR
jgi:hypothetical protein